MPPEAIIHFELKYCERCGGLWLRRCNVLAIYCSPCARQMEEIARGRLHRLISCMRAGARALSTCLVTWGQPWLTIALERIA